MGCLLGEGIQIDWGIEISRAGEVEDMKRKKSVYMLPHKMLPFFVNQRCLYR